MKLKSSQKGFTLIEVLIATAVGGMLLTGLVTATFQTLAVTADSRTRITALEDVKDIARRITTDVGMAQTTNLALESPTVYDTLVLDWTSWHDDSGMLSSVDRQCEYTSPSSGSVQRNYDPDTDPTAGGDESSATFGRHISDIEFSRQGRIVIVTITSSPEGEPEIAEQKTYYIALRPMDNPEQQP